MIPTMTHPGLAQGSSRLGALHRLHSGLFAAISRCPRCCEPFDDRYSAGSRATEDRVDICAACSSDEAGYSINGLRMSKVTEWPVRRRFGSDLSPLVDAETVTPSLRPLSAD